MADPAIKVENLGKKYRLQHRGQRPRYVALRDVLAQKGRSLLRYPWALMRAWMESNANSGASNSRRTTQEDFWALKDVSFEVQRGEVAGIIGRNGAGKSTLLKLLSRITEPTEGRIEIEGRVASLLEVGTGFHPELTGRENIFLNGAILGMTRAEIRNKFDSIVAFAETEKFLDTPVKHYSSGMFVRLAFAVAAHMEPEIVVVDEVLAVGDAEFQKKCLGKMHDLSHDEGRTVLFVSHNLTAVSTLCQTGVLLSGGRMCCKSDVQDVLKRYLQQANPASDLVWIRNSHPAPDNLGFSRISARVEGEQPNLRLFVQCTFIGRPTHRPAMLAIDISDSQSCPIMQALPSVEPFITPKLSKHPLELEIELPPLVPGVYRVTAWVGPHNTETYDTVRECVAFTIPDSPTRGRSFPHSPDHGFLVPPCRVHPLLS